MGLSEIIRYCIRIIRYTPESTDSSSFFLLIGHKWWYVKKHQRQHPPHREIMGRPGAACMKFETRGVNHLSCPYTCTCTHTQWTRILWIWFKHVQSCLYSNPQNEMFGQGMTTVSNENYHLDGPLRTIHIHGFFARNSIAPSRSQVVLWLCLACFLGDPTGVQLDR